MTDKLLGGKKSGLQKQSNIDEAIDDRKLLLIVSQNLRKLNTNIEKLGINLKIISKVGYDSVQIQQFLLSENNQKLFTEREGLYQFRRNMFIQNQ